MGAAKVLVQKVEASSLRLRLVDQYPQLQLSLRSLCLDRLRALSSLSEWELFECENWDAFCFGSHMSIIMVAGRDLQVLFKAHFKANKLLRAMPQLEDLACVLDFVKEFTNLVAGAIKRLLTDQEYLCGISLPNITSGYDEAFFSDTIKNGRLNDYFVMKQGKAEIVVTLAIQCKSTKILESLNSLQVQSEEQVEIEIDFL